MSTLLNKPTYQTYQPEVGRWSKQDKKWSMYFLNASQMYNSNTAHLCYNMMIQDIAFSTLKIGKTKGVSTHFAGIFLLQQPVDEASGTE